MLLAGIQGKSELDPRLKHSGVTPLGVASLHPQPPIFKGGHEGFKYLFFYFVLFVTSVVKSPVLLCLFSMLRA